MCVDPLEAGNDVLPRLDRDCELLPSDAIRRGVLPHDADDDAASASWTCVIGNHDRFRFPSGDHSDYMLIRPIFHRVSKRGLIETLLVASETTIVIPCYNEARRLDADSFARYVAGSPGVRLLFVDDGSTDDTRAVLEQLIARKPGPMRLLALDHNQGKAEAVRAGFVAAFEADPTYVGFWDADLATPLSDIDRFAALLDERPLAVAVFGSRVNLLGRDVHRNLMRHYIGRVFATMAAFALRLPIYDTQCGAKMFRATDEVRSAFAQPFRSRWIFDVEIVARLRATWPTSRLGSFRKSLYEYPLMAWHDVAGSKLKLKDFFVVGLDLLGIALRYRKAVRQQAAAESRLS